MNDIASADLQREVYEYARGNIAKLSIFLREPYVSRYIREEKITQITFVGTVGGIFGLFSGFSFISAVEIVYLGCLWCWGKFKDRHEKRVNEVKPFKSDGSTTVNKTPVVPISYETKYLKNKY